MTRQSSPAAPGTRDTGRLVAPFHELKGRLATWSCAADGALYPCEIQTRHLTRNRIKELMHLERGERVHWRDARVIGDPPTLRAEELG